MMILWTIFGISWAHLKSPGIALKVLLLYLPWILALHYFYEPNWAFNVPENFDGMIPKKDDEGIEITINPVTDDQSGLDEVSI